MANSLLISSYWMNNILLTLDLYIDSEILNLSSVTAGFYSLLRHLVLWVRSGPPLIQNFEAGSCLIILMKLFPCYNFDSLKVCCGKIWMLCISQKPVGILLYSSLSIVLGKYFQSNIMKLPLGSEKYWACIYTIRIRKDWMFDN